MTGQRIDLRPRCRLGCAMAPEDCQCCGATTWACPSHAYTEVRDGVRYAAPLRCIVCANAGCRGTRDVPIKVRCGRMRTTEPTGTQPPRRAV